MADGIYKRGKGYVVVIPWGKDPAGKYRQKWFSGFKTIAAAKAKRAKMLTLREQGGEVANTRETVGAYLDRWLAGHVPHLSPVTAESYRSTIRVHLTPAFGAYKLRELGPESIRQYLTDKLAAGKSPTTVRYHLMVLREAVQQAVRDGLLDRNWVDNVTRPKKQRKEMQVLTRSRSGCSWPRRSDPQNTTGSTSRRCSRACGKANSLGSAGAT